MLLFIDNPVLKDVSMNKNHTVLKFFLCCYIHPQGRSYKIGVLGSIFKIDPSKRKTQFFFCS